MIRFVRESLLSHQQFLYFIFMSETGTWQAFKTHCSGPERGNFSVLQHFWSNFFIQDTPPHFFYIDFRLCYVRESKKALVPISYVQGFNFFHFYAFPLIKIKWTNHDIYIILPSSQNFAKQKTCKICFTVF